jgi:hypothetical protein
MKGFVAGVVAGIAIGHAATIVVAVLHYRTIDDD